MAISVLGTAGTVMFANHDRSTENATKHIEEVKRSTGVDETQRFFIEHNHNKMENHAERISALEALIKRK